MSLRLIIEDYEGETTIVPLNEAKAPVTVGREDNNTIQLTEQNVSRAHARLNFDGMMWALEDLESYNGVRVNGIMIDEPIPLQEGDVIQIGDYRLLLSAAEKRRVLDEALTAANGTQTRAGGSGRLPTLTSTELHSMLSDAVTSDRGGAHEDDAPRGDGSGDAVTQRNTLQVMPTPLGPDGERISARELIAGVSVSDLSDPDRRDDTQSRPGYHGQVDTELPERSGSGKIWLLVVVLALIAGGGAAWQLNLLDLRGELKNTMSQATVGGGSPGRDSGRGNRKDGHGRGTALAEDNSRHNHPGNINPGTSQPDDQQASDPGQRALQSDDEDFDAELEKELGDDDEEDTPEGASSQSRSGAPERTRRPSVAREQLRRAREASLAGDQSRAYRLSRDSYANDPSPAALQLMGLAACKMGQRSSARTAYRRMRNPEHRRLLSQVCASNGIDLG